MVRIAKRGERAVNQTDDFAELDLYGVFLEVRDAAAKILESTSVADIVGGQAKARKKSKSKKKAKKGPVLSIVHKNASGS